MSGLSAADLVTAWRDLQLRGLVVLEPDGAGGAAGTVRLSDKATSAYRLRVRRLADPVGTAWTLVGALLDWLTSGSAGFRFLAEFQRDPRSVLEGLRPTGHDELSAAAMFLADRGMVELIDTSGSQLAKVKITEDGRSVADRYWRTSRSLTAFDPATDASQSDEKDPGQRDDTTEITASARPERAAGSAISADESRAMTRFLDGLRRVVAVDDMPDERRGEMFSLVDRLTIATQDADLHALRRCWEHARRPLQAAGPILAHFLAGAAIPPVLTSPDPSRDAK
ncbi:hypothetical protein [Kribbella sp. NBC_00359]|uniref:hypothetical protein n=1 Tax=Kribbella sp. NBC_00359 TaxID=2975966 RepID=UPI002E1BFBDC